jgi:hypothetical protein
MNRIHVQSYNQFACPYWKFGCLEDGFYTEKALCVLLVWEFVYPFFIYLSERWDKWNNENCNCHSYFQIISARLLRRTTLFLQCNYRKNYYQNYNAD